MSELVGGYRTIGQIGVGAHSTIHHAVRTTTGKSYAIKRVVNESSGDLKFINQVEVEYEVSSKVKHPNLRHCYSIHRTKKLLTVQEIRVVMEYAEGETLQDRRPGSLDAFLYILHRVAAGLQALHEAGYVHADVKPNNIIVGKDGSVKVIDFGQACPILHRKERIQGTPDYIAPEQVQRVPLDQRTDVFNLGATMYWVLTEIPYPTAIRQPTRRGGIDLVSRETLRTPHEVNELIPVPLSQLIMDCCRENPQDRPSDMRAVMGRLEMVQSLWNKKRKNAITKRKSSGQNPRADPKGDERQ
ncbi:MAG: serine/threonine protein kinase [Phycisphaerae bacterium]|nr:serine/threonine protein kinase [Phycisphaerae bacterium]